jgi:hypothetical protein
MSVSAGSGTSAFADTTGGIRTGVSGSSRRRSISSARRYAACSRNCRHSGCSAVSISDPRAGEGACGKPLPCGGVAASTKSTSDSSTPATGRMLNRGSIVPA